MLLVSWKNDRDQYFKDETPETYHYLASVSNPKKRLTGIFTFNGQMIRKVK